MTKAIQEWDILIIPNWYTIVKRYLGTAMKKLKQLRESKGLSQLQLALKLGLNQNTVSRYENGQREADYQTLIMFADFFDVSIDYLIGRTEDKKAKSFPLW